MSSSTVPRDQQVSHLREEVDGEFAPLSDAVDAASNVLEAFGASTGDPNAQAAIIGPKLRETYDDVYEQVLALCGHEVHAATDSPGEMLEHFSELFGALVELARASMEMDDRVPRDALPMKGDVACYVHTLERELTKVCRRVSDWEEAMEVHHAS